jgi:Na+-transporting NADH:ubiquinone oxidoreductase subunit C
VVLPIYGNGLWSMMYAFVALDTDGRTVKALPITIRAKRRGWAAKLKTLTGGSSLSARKCWMITDAGAESDERGGASGDDYAVDGLSGATLTSNGVQHSFDFWMGELGFGPFLKNVREGALNNG